MILKELLNSHMVLQRYRVGDMAKKLHKTKQSISQTLYRDLNRITIGTLKSYCAAVGLFFDLDTFIKKCDLNKKDSLFGPTTKIKRLLRAVEDPRVLSHLAESQGYGIFKLSPGEKSNNFLPLGCSCQDAWNSLSKRLQKLNAGAGNNKALRAAISTESYRLISLLAELHIAVGIISAGPGDAGTAASLKIRK